SAAPGFPASSALLPIMLSEGYDKRKLPLEKIAHLTSTQPAISFGLYPRKGFIGVGADADFAIVDLNWERTVTPELCGYGDYTVYDGMAFKGWPVYTVSRGEVIQERGKVTGRSGRGIYLRRSI
ncbi:MAG: amidohydrolase, partial [Firmicutes bacterium]|nr:amidohydrolase [Bacillota bacterium]